MTCSSILFLILLLHSASVDCPNMIQFAFGLGIPSNRPLIWTALQNNCCIANGVNCSQRVTHISWYNVGSNGTINETAIPSKVEQLWLYGNSLTGNITSLLPSGLIWLELEQNQLTGPIPNILPSGLAHLGLFDNQMTGDLPTFPFTLQYLALGYPGYAGNSFTGTLRLNQPY